MGRRRKGMGGAFIHKAWRWDTRGERKGPRVTSILAQGNGTGKRHLQKQRFECNVSEATFQSVGIPSAMIQKARTLASFFKRVHNARFLPYKFLAGDETNATYQKKIAPVWIWITGDWNHRTFGHKNALAVVVRLLNDRGMIGDAGGAGERRHPEVTQEKNWLAYVVLRHTKKNPDVYSFGGLLGFGDDRDINEFGRRHGVCGGLPFASESERLRQSDQIRCTVRNSRPRLATPKEGQRGPLDMRPGTRSDGCKRWDSGDGLYTSMESGTARGCTGIGNGRGRGRGTINWGSKVGDRSPFPYMICISVSSEHIYNKLDRHMTNGNAGENETLRLRNLYSFSHRQT